MSKPEGNRPLVITIHLWPWSDCPRLYWFQLPSTQRRSRS